MTSNDTSMASSSNRNEVLPQQKSEIQTFKKPVNRIMELCFSCQGCGRVLKTMNPIFNIGGAARHTDSNQFGSWRSVHELLVSSCRLQTVSCEGVARDGARDERSNRMISQLKEYKLLEDEVEAYIAAESGMDRIRRVLAVDPVTKEMSLEMKFVSAATMQTMGILFLFGFITKGREGKQQFLTRNKTTLYATKSMANKRMFNAMIQSGMKGSFNLMLKGGSFIIPALIGNRGLDVYYNKTSPIHMMVPCGIVGCLWKISLGLKGMFAGGVIASVLGLAMGALWTAGCKMLGETQEIITYQSVRGMIERQQTYRRPVVPEEDVAEEDL